MVQKPVAYGPDCYSNNCSNNHDSSSNISYTTNPPNIIQTGQNIIGPINGSITIYPPNEIRPDKATPASTTSHAPATLTDSTEKYVKVNYSGQPIDMMPYATPDIGKRFLLVDITIANHGYDDVTTLPDYFHIEINNVKYRYDSSSSYSLKNIDKLALEMVDLADGGQISGYLVFQIPANENKYQLIYDNFDGYDVRYD